jgi:hypothetical protein
MNLVIFLDAGFFIPYAFTSSTLETPTVLSSRGNCEKNVKNTGAEFDEWPPSHGFELLRMAENIYLDCNYSEVYDIYPEEISYIPLSFL